MWELTGSERERVRGEAARVFLKTVHYDDDEIAVLGDLSLLSAAQVKELLEAKRDQIEKTARTSSAIRPHSARYTRTLRNRNEAYRRVGV